MQRYYFPKLLLFFTIIILCVCSCNKHVDDTVMNGIKDSSLLIKSITNIIYGRDSVTEYYSYDSANRKINIHWIYDFNYPNFSSTLQSADLNYNNKLLLSHVSYNYKKHKSEDRSEIDINYDAENILQKIVIKYFNGKNTTINFYKTILGGGKYQLDWVEHYVTNGVADSTILKSSYDNDGRCLSAYFSYSSPALYDDNGNILDSTLRMVNKTYIYDAEGNLNKIQTDIIDTFQETHENNTAVEFSGRLSKGNELYNQRQALLNGIANIPEITNSSDATFIDMAGILSWFPFEFESQSFVNFPYTTAKSYSFMTKKYYNSTGRSEFDDKGRLVSFSGSLYGNDFAWRITYFK
jgi:hypothetical protein